ncbi:MAG: exosortase/archaeosortase family protein, partial [Fervidobacterium sp.]
DVNLMKKLKQKLKQALTKAKIYHLPILAIALIFLLIFLVYRRDLEALTNEALNTEVLTYIILVPFFAGFLFFQKKDLFKASLVLEKLQKQPKAKHVDEFIGLSICLIAFLLYWYGSYTFYPLEYHMLSLPIFVTGIILILFNLKALETLILPILFLSFLIPIPNEIMSTIGGTLANFNTQASYALLKPLGLPVTLSTSYGAPTLILTTAAGNATSFTIDLPCSGIYTFIAFTMFAIFLAITVSVSAFKRIMIFILGFAIFEVLNVFRIAIIISTAYFFGEAIAMTIFHTIAGLLLTFIGMLLTLFASDKLLRIKFSSKPNETPPCPKCKETQKSFESFCLNCGKFFNTLKMKLSRTFWAKLIILLLGFSVIALSVNAPTFAIAKGTIEVTSTWENATNIFPQISEYNLKFLYRDINYERIAKQDVSLTYAYFPNNFSQPVVYVLIGVANSISNLHSWEVCLISWQTAQGQYPLVSVLDSRDIQLLEEGFPLIARYLVFQNQQNYTQVTLYWYEKATFRTGITIQQKFVRISLIILTRNSTNYHEYENQLLNFGKAIAYYWEPIKSQSLISLGIPAQQVLLILSIAFVITVKTTEYANEWRRRTNNLKIFNNFASSKDKMVFQTVTELSRRMKAITTIAINLAIKRKVGKFMKFESLVERLNRLQEYGFVKMDLISNNNKPLLVWKSLVNI